MFNQFLQLLDRRTKDSEANFFPLGLLAIFGFAGWYFLWHDIDVQTYENLPLRIIASVLGLFIVLRNYWPRTLKPYFPLYWYIALLYFFPFFFSFMLFKNNFAHAWQMNGMLGLALMILLVDWLDAAIISTIGILIAWISYKFTSTGPMPPFTSILGALLNYLNLIVFFGLFTYRKSRIQKEKLKTLYALSGSIAHELRTPLFALKSSLKGLKRYVPVLIEGYQQAKKAHLPVQDISPTHREALFKALNTAENELIYANTIINMLLMKVNRSPKTLLEDFEVCSIDECVTDAIKRYPFSSQEQRNLVHIDIKIKFTFLGKKLAFEHILFNLIKNALYYIQVAKKGQIYIWTSTNPTYYFLHFKDTGAGISSKTLPKLFTHFFTTSNHGTGLGLAFCKMMMQNFSGDIICLSEEKIYTEFVLSFPKTNKIN